MKKTIIFFIAIIMMLGSVSPAAVLADDTVNIGETAMFINCTDKSSDFRVEADSIGDIKAGSYAKFRVNFGEGGARRLILSYSVPAEYANKTVNFYLDDMDKETPDAVLTTQSTNDWWLFKEFGVNVDSNVFNGERDVYVVFPQNSMGNFYSLRFVDECVQVEKLDLKCYRGNFSSSFSMANRMTASASVYAGTLTPKKVGIVVCLYDENHDLYGIAEESTEPEPDSQVDFNVVLNLTSELKQNVKYAGAYIYYGDSFLQSAYYQRVTPKTAVQEFNKAIEAECANGMIDVSGKINSAESILLIMRDSEGNAVYANEIPAKNGNYSLTFNPNTANGEYTLTVMDSDANMHTASINYVSVKDITDRINKAQSSDEIRNILEENSSVLGIDTASANKYDSDYIYEKIYENRETAIQNIQKAFNLYLAIEMVNGGSITEAVTKYGISLGISTENVDIYKKNSADNEKALQTAVSAYGRVETAEEFYKLFQQAVLAPNASDAYTEYSFTSSSDYTPTLEMSDHCGNTSPGAYVKFKQLNFKELPARSFGITYAVDDSYAGRDINIYLDDMNKSVPDLTYRTSSTGGWETYKQFNVPIPETQCNAFAGIHDVYVVFTNHGCGNMKSISFGQKYIDFNGVKLTMIDSSGKTTNDVSKAVTVNAEGNIHLYTGKPNRLVLVTAVYDKNNMLIKMGISEADGVDDSNERLSVSLTDIVPSEGMQVYANILDGDYNTYARAAGTLFGGYIPQQYNGIKSVDGIVDISGKTDESAEYVTIAVTSEKNSYENCPLVYEVNTEKGLYGVKINMPDSAVTGKYTAVVSDNLGNVKETQFSYVNVKQAESAVNAISSAQSAEKTEELIIGNADKLDLDLSYINSSSTKSDIYKYIYEANKESKLDSASKIKNAVSCAEAIDKINNGEKAVDIIQEYADTLGNYLNDKYLIYFNETDKKLIESRIAGQIQQAGKINGLKDFEYKLKSAIILTCFDKEIAWGSINTMLNDFNDILKLTNLTQYNKMTDDSKYRVCSGFIGHSPFKEVSEIGKEFTSFYNAEVKRLNNKTSGGGSGGNGGGRGDMFAGTPSEKKEENTAPIDVSLIKPKTEFTDLGGYEWAKEAIAALVDKGVISGRNESIFDPSARVTREEFIKMLVLAFGIENNENAVQFNDLSADMWCRQYVNAAVSAGIVNGYDDGRFGVGESITREDISVFAYRASRRFEYFLDENNSTVSFIDLDEASEYARESVMKLARANIVNGVGSDRFSPKAMTTRAEAAVIIYRILNTKR